MVPSSCPIHHRHRTVRNALPGAVLAFALGGCTSPPSLDRLETPDDDASFRSRVYAGAGVGNSHLTPDTSGTVFNVDDTEDLGTELRLGVDLHDRLAVELGTSVLGTATLREAGTDVNYSAASISALVYVLNGVQLRSRREGWSAYGRLGIGILKKSSAVVALEEGGSVPLFGLGAEYGLPNGLGIRGEITRFDEDALYAGIGAVYRFGFTPREAGELIAETARPALASGETRVGRGGRTLSRKNRFGTDDSYASDAASPEPTLQAARPSTPWRPPVHAGEDDRDRDGVRGAGDRCPDTGAGIAVDGAGCGLFDVVLADVVFKSGSHWLTARARGSLDELSERLLAFPEVRVRVLAHTDSTGPADANLALSARRAESVVQYLESRGVAELQLEARGFGETRPLASNRDPEGRLRNRRVEIETLPSTDPALLAGAANADDRQEPVRWLPPVALAAGTARATPGTADGGESLVPWRARPEPALGAASAVVAAVDAVADLVGSRPTPLPRPGIVPGLAVVGVVPNLGFVTGSAEFLPDAEPELVRIAESLRAYPEARVAIMAHTDDQGLETDNLALSVARAETVLEHLVDLGIERTRLEAEGYGESLPLVQNLTAEDRARNRRVELRVLR